MKIFIRSANIDDLSTLLKFEQGIITTERPFDECLAEDPISYYDLKELILSEEAEVAVAVVNNEVVGSGYARIKESDVYNTHDRHSFLGFMYVEPDQRGKGINKLIIDHLVLWSKKRGLNHFKLQVYSDNVVAIKAYEKVGFKKSMVKMYLEI